MPAYEDTNAVLIKGILKSIFLFLYLCVLVAELLRKRKSEAIPSLVVRQSSFVILLFSRGLVLGTIIRPQNCFENRSTNGPGLIRNCEAIVSLAPWIDVTDFQPFRNMTVRMDKSTQNALYI